MELRYAKLTKTGPKPRPFFSLRPSLSPAVESHVYGSKMEPVQPQSFLLLSAISHAYP